MVSVLDFLIGPVRLYVVSTLARSKIDKEKQRPFFGLDWQSAQIFEKGKVVEKNPDVYRQISYCELLLPCCAKRQLPYCCSACNLQSGVSDVQRTLMVVKIESFSFNFNLPARETPQ